MSSKTYSWPDLRAIEKIFWIPYFFGVALTAVCKGVGNVVDRNGGEPLKDVIDKHGGISNTLQDPLIIAAFVEGVVSMLGIGCLVFIVTITFLYVIPMYIKTRKDNS